MKRQEILHQLSMTGIVPVVILKDAQNAVPLAKALAEGGIPAAEVTFRTDAAAEGIAAIAEEAPEVLVGAGTVTNVAMAQKALEAGARYIVSPGLNADVVKWCCAHDVPVLPGVATPTEVEAAMALGLSALKFFPAEQNGGIPMLKALASPYRKVKFIPTGGVGPANLAAYLALPNVLACGGSWICPPECIERGEWKKITKLCEQAVAELHGFTLMRAELSGSTSAEARRLSEKLAFLFQIPCSEEEDAISVGAMFSVKKQQSEGTHGVLTVGCNEVERAMAWLSTRGAVFGAEGVVRDARGAVSARLKGTFGGFALRLQRRG